MSYPYTKSHTVNGTTIVAFRTDGSGDVIYTIDQSHPNFGVIEDGLRAEDPNVWDLFAVVKGAIRVLQNLSDRVSWDGETVFWDGDPISDPIARHLERVLESGRGDYKPLVAFWEKVAQNPDENSKAQLFQWLLSHDFSVTPDGDIVGYKGVTGERKSIHSGFAIVDGEEINGHVPNEDGSVITMPRSKVAANPDVACSYGLHVGDWSYASSFGSIVLEVHVNPRDVVSIPRDSSERKMRCCRYKVIRQLEQKYDSPVVSDEYAPRVGE